MVANTGQHEGVAAPAVLLPSSLDGGAGGSQPLEGKTAGICWKVCPIISCVSCMALWSNRLLHGEPAVITARGHSFILTDASAATKSCCLPYPAQWFDDAAPAVAHACNAAVSLLEAQGLKVVEIQVGSVREGGGGGECRSVCGQRGQPCGHET